MYDRSKNMLLCGLGLLFSVASFILFVLPSFVLRILGWAVLTALFGAAGSYCHDRLKGRSSSPSYHADQDFYDVTEEASGSNTKESCQAQAPTPSGSYTGAPDGAPAAPCRPRRTPASRAVDRKSVV